MRYRLNIHFQEYINIYNLIQYLIFLSVEFASSATFINKQDNFKIQFPIFDISVGNKNLWMTYFIVFVKVTKIVLKKRMTTSRKSRNIIII